jgi:hypothetical protein
VARIITKISFKHPAHKPWGPMKIGEPARKGLRIAKRIRQQLKDEGCKYGFNKKAAEQAMDQMRAEGYTGRDLYQTILSELRRHRKPAWDKL